jgi:hypothetical protein
MCISLKFVAFYLKKFQMELVCLIKISFLFHENVVSKIKRFREISTCMVYVLSSL